MVSKWLSTPSKGILLVAVSILWFPTGIDSSYDRETLCVLEAFHYFAVSWYHYLGRRFICLETRFHRRKSNIVRKVRYQNIPTFESFILIPSIFIFLLIIAVSTCENLRGEKEEEESDRHVGKRSCPAVVMPDLVTVNGNSIIIVFNILVSRFWIVSFPISSSLYYVHL